MKLTPYFSKDSYEDHGPTAVGRGSVAGSLYFVTGRDGNHIPVSCYVQAASPEDACKRVREACEEFAAAAGLDTMDGQRMAKYLPVLSFEAEPVPQGWILNAGQAWASNSGFSC